MTIAANIRVNTAVPFPSLVQVSGPITVSKSSGIWTFGFSIANLQAKPPVQANLPTNFVLAYDSVLKSFFTISEAALIGVEAGYQSANNTTGFTATAVQMAGAGVQVLELTGTLGAGQNITTPTAAQLLAAMPNGFAGQGYILRIKNSSGANFAWTLVADASITLSGTVTIAQNTWRDFLVTFTSLTAATIHNVGSGTA